MVDNFCQNMGYNIFLTYNKKFTQQISKFFKITLHNANARDIIMSIIKIERKKDGNNRKCNKANN